MRTVRHLYSTGSATLVACLTALATGCSGDVGGGADKMSPTAGEPTTTSSSATGSGGASNGTTGTTTSGGGTGGVPLPPNVCVPGIQSTSQVARLKNAHYDNIVRDLLGLTVLANGEPPSSLLNTDSIGAMN